MEPQSIGEIIEHDRRRHEEWHDACVACGKRYQGIGANCGACIEIARVARHERERRDAILADTKSSRDMVPPWNGWATFNKLAAHPGIDRVVLEGAKQWKRNRGNLVLSGPTGIGKTACAHAIARRILAIAIAAKDLADDDRWFACNVRWYTASTLSLARKQARLGDGEADAVMHARGASLLFIDELGFETTYDGTLFDIVDRRYVRRLPTIVTTGRRESQLVEIYGAAFVRRLRELGTIVDAFPKGEP